MTPLSDGAVPLLEDSRVLVTGGAGFIGSHVVDGLLAAGASVTVVDDLSSGTLDNLPRDHITFVHGDIRDPGLLDACMPGMDQVWHLAANPEVRTGHTDPAGHYDLNVHATWQVLQAVRRHEVPYLGFTSTSTVYGNAPIPTPETHGPLKPISVYGGAKLACEGLVASMASTFGFDATMWRFANVVGPRSNHGVTYDFVHKLKATPDRLEILGDGTQTKSYVSVFDTVDAMIHSARQANGVEVYNIGSLDGIPVMEIARIVAEVMGLEPEFATTGGTSDGAGWVGDVKHMGLAIDAIQATGWKPEHGSADAIRLAAEALMA